MSDLEKTEVINKVSGRVNLFKVTTASMMRACEEFVTLTAKVGQVALIVISIRNGDLHSAADAEERF